MALSLPRHIGQVSVVTAALVAVTGALAPAAAYADSDGAADLLDGSMHALVMGPTFLGNPALIPGYMPAIEANYLEQLGFSHDATLTALPQIKAPPSNVLKTFVAWKLNTEISPWRKTLPPPSRTPNA